MGDVELVENAGDDKVDQIGDALRMVVPPLAP
jgi:hypothetical protein